MSRKFVHRSVSLLVMFMLTFGLVSSVLADSGDPTSINAVVNGQDVTVSGQWTWEDNSCNDSSKKIVGWAVAWGEPGFTGNPVPKDGGGNYYMGEAGTYPTTQGNHVFTDGQLCGSFPGPWGPLTHHYSAPGTYQICVIIYDLRADDIGETGAHSDVAGGANRNTDNSVEENFTEVENCEPGTVIIPSTPTLATEVRFNGANAPENVALGTTVTDQAILGETQNNGPVTGEVDFFVCGPTAAPANCNAGTSAGANRSISSGVANSNGVELASSGWYCFRAEYDSNTVHYNDTSHTNATTECVYAKPTITVEKTANPTTIAEPGGPISYTVSVTNNGGPNGVAAVTITSLTDDKFGNLDGKGGCDVTPGVILAAGASFSCTFSENVSGDAGQTHVNTATASGKDSNNNDVSAHDDATVTFTDVLPIVATIKAANPTTLPEPGGTVTFSVSVENKSVETVTLTSLSDTIFGDLLDPANPAVTDNTCDDVSKTIAAGAFFTCSFKGAVTGNAGFVHTNTVNACAKDNEQNPACDEGSATVTITNVPPTTEVTKTANPTTVPEPGATVTFTVTVKNTSFETVTLTSLEDTVYGDLLDGANPAVTDNTCDTVSKTIASGATFSCTFKGAVSGDSGFVHENTVEGCAADNDQTQVCHEATATVTVTDVLPIVATIKAANPTSLPEPGGTVTFSVSVENKSVETVTLTSLSDTIFGDLLDPANPAVTDNTCDDVSKTIAAGAFFTCSFKGAVTGNAGFVHTNTVNACAKDNEQNPACDEGSATVTITNVPPTTEVTKTANPTTVPEPGATVTFTVTVKNTSFETVTLTSLSDTVYGDLLDGANPAVTDNTCDTVSKTIASGATFSCTFKGAVSGDSGFVHENTVEGCAADNDQTQVCHEATATVTVTDVLPIVATIKAANPTSLPEPGGTVTFSVSVENKSVETVTLTSLSDTIFGDLLDPANPAVTDNTCDNVSKTIAAGAFFTCSFKGAVTGNAGFVHTNTVNACAKDNEQNPACDEGSATVTITNVPPTTEVTKTANPTTVPEPGATVTFTVTVKNTSFETVTLTSLEDTVYGDLLDGANPAVTDNTCDTVSKTIASGATFSCTFKGAVSGDSGFVHENTVEGCAADNDQTQVCHEATATVTVTDVLPIVATIKAANPTSLPEPGGTVTFSVSVENKSVETVTLTSLSDTIFGDLLDPANPAVTDNTCDDVSKTIAAGAFFTCSFKGAVTGNAGFVHTNTVNACAKDNEQNPACDEGSATVTITDVPPTTEVTKTANPTTVPEPGATVTFTVTVKNTSFETVTLTSLEDTVYGDLLDGANPAVTDNTCDTVSKTIASGATFSCTFKGAVSGDSGFVHENTVEGCAADNDQTQVCHEATATVTVTDVEPTLTVTKTASDNSVSVGDPVTFTVVVTNTSVEPVTITSLNDSIYGNLATRPGSTCDDLIGDTLGIGASATCTFTAIATESETNVVTVCIADDDENEECGTDDEHVVVLNPGIRIAKVPDAAGVVAGQPIGFRIILFNAGVGNASGIKLRDLLPTDIGLNWTIAPSGVGQAWGDQGASCAITATVPKTLECGGASGVNVPGSLSRDDSFFTVHIISTTTAATSAESPIHNDACVESSNEPQVCAQADVDVFALTVDKANDAAVRHIELPGGGFVDVKTQDEGKLVTYTLTYDVGTTAVHDVDLVDVLPAGLTFQASPAPTSSNAQLTFVGAVGQTLTWHADTLSGDGTVTYVAKVDVGASKIGELINHATIDSDETPADTAQSTVFVPAPPKVETHIITGPPTDVLPTQGEAGPGSSMIVILAALGLLVVAIGFVTPAPAAVRRRNSRQR